MFPDAEVEGISRKELEFFETAASCRATPCFLVYPVHPLAGKDSHPLLSGPEAVWRE